MLPNPIPRNREPGRAGALGRVLATMAVALATGAIGPVDSPATAQPPGLDRFAKPPETPLELWSAITYLTRVGLGDQALPLLDQFLAANPDDDTLLTLRDRFGIGSILKLQDDPRTADRVGEILSRLNAAVRRNAQREDRIRRYVGLLTGSPLQQSEALNRLGESGPYAVPVLLEAINALPPDSADRALLVANMGRLQRRAVPALIAGLDAPDPQLAADVASALGRIGDRRALPFLIADAASTDAERAPLSAEAAEAVLRLSGKPLDEFSQPPARLILDEARRYLLGLHEFPGTQVVLWTWNNEAGTVVPQNVAPSDVETVFGLRFAEAAHEIAPDDPNANAILTTFQVREALLRRDPAELAAPGELPEDLATELVGLGADSLTNALRLALQSKKFQAAPALITALALTGDASMLASDPPSPIVQALSAPDRRVQLAAARAIVALDPARSFPGSSRVVPSLARSIDSTLAQPQIVVVSGNPTTLTNLASSLRDRGFEPITASTADEGFLRAAESAGVDAVIVDPAFLQGRRDARDLLIDLRADARTARLPVLLPLPIDPARALARAQEYEFFQAEREPNDIPARAAPVAFVGRPRRAQINGRLSPTDRPPFGQPEREWPPQEDQEEPEEPPFPPRDDAADSPAPVADISGDLYALGPLDSGDTISAIIEPAPGSTLKPTDVVLWLDRREGTKGVPVAQGIGSLSARIDVPGVYDLRVQAVERYLYGYLAMYKLDLSIYDYDIAVAPLSGTARLSVEELAGQFDHVSLLAAPGDPMAVERALYRAWDEAGIRPNTPDERLAIVQSAADTLAQIADRPGGPFATDMAAVVPSLQRLMADPRFAASAAQALSVVPTLDAQRALAENAIDPSRALETQRAAADALRRSVQQFGPLLALDQRSRLIRAKDRAEDAELRAALEDVINHVRGSLSATPLQPESAPSTD
ncbi:HEAT repeat domain-containing protein [Tautonia marina]|uniref:HEAT repeat domain-containing protein n=1 Tax=Tautonia marina TaxID=2653855 RepID=UPI001260F194|nr:HEAT repeat domain-containing protein [Tautonia marina]